MPGDPYYAVMPDTPYLDEIGKDPGSLSIAMVPASPDGCTPVDAEVREGSENTGKLLESLGHRITPEAAPYDFWPLYDTYMRIGAVVTAALVRRLCRARRSRPQAGTRPRTSIGRQFSTAAAYRPSITTTTSRNSAPCAATSWAAWPPTMRG